MQVALLLLMPLLPVGHSQLTGPCQHSQPPRDLASVEDKESSAVAATKLRTLFLMCTDETAFPALPAPFPLCPQVEK